MGARQREATWVPTRQDRALARQGLACVIVWTLALAPGRARAEPAKETAPSSRKRTEPVRLPGHTRGDTGRVADPRTLHGDSKIEGANATAPAGERVVRPISPASTQTRPGEATEPPPFHYVPVAPAARATLPASEVWLAPTMPWTGTIETAPPATPTPIDAGTATGAHAGSTAPPTATDRGARAVDAGPPALDAPQVSEKNTQPTAESPHPSPEPGEPTRRANKRQDRANKARPAKPETASEDAPPDKSEEPKVPDVLDQIRMEIKARLPYFQACAEGARRRAGLEVRRLQATWFINADGTIKEFRLDEVPDAQLAACLVRAGSRPFPIQPGVDLTVPTPIVFVR